MGRWLALLVLGGALPSPATASDGAPVVEIRAAFDGVARFGHWTEFTVEVLSQQSGDVTVRTGTSRVASRVNGRITAGVEGTIRVPVFVEASVVPVTLIEPNGTETMLEVPLRIPGPASRVVAHSGGSQPTRQNAIVLASVPSRNLPRFAEAYEGLDLLVLDAREIADLSWEQLRAIRQYVRRCGRLLLLHPHPTLHGWSEAEACSGDLVETTLPDADLDEPIARLLKARAPVTLRAETLGRDLDAVRPHTARTPVIALFSVYAVVLVVGGLLLGNLWSLALLPISASLLLLGVFALADPAPSGAFWLEARSGQPTARLTAIVRIDGLSQRSTVVEIPAALGLPEPVAGNDMLLDVAGRDGRHRVNLETRLFSRHSLALVAGIDWTPTLSLDVSAGGLSVRNSGSVVSEPGFALWNERVYALPAIAPGQEVDPTTSGPLPRSHQPGPVVRALSAIDGPAVLVPDDRRHPLDLLGEVEWTGWTILSAEIPR